jgi:hypothetical protein
MVLRGGRVALVNRALGSRVGRCLLMGLGCAPSACDGSALVTTRGLDDAGAGGSAQAPVDGGVEGAPRCESGSVPFVPVFVQGTEALGLAWHAASPVRVRVVERGVGLPPEGTNIAFASLANESGWLRLGAPLAESIGDAGVANGDAGDAGHTSAEVPPIIVGPRAIGELPLAIGDEVVLSVVDNANLPLYPGVHQVVLEREGGVLLFHQTGVLSSPDSGAGFSLARAATVCEEAAACQDVYHSALQVTVPGGATATLAPGQTDTVGDYQVSHGSTVSNVRHEPNTCNDVLYDQTYNEITAVLLPEAE